MNKKSLLLAVRYLYYLQYPRIPRVVREHGGLVIADEVQSGLGRAGSNMWAFMDHGLTPDIVTLGKVGG